MPSPSRSRPGAAVPAADAERAPPKLAEQVAARIAKEIIRRSWKVGELLGAEAELAKRYGTSRWVMREAISIAEHDGLIEIRRGRNGGIAVAAPALDTIGSSIRGYLNVSRVSGRHLTEARALLESLAMSLAAARLDNARIERLRAAAARAEAADEANSLDLAYGLLHEILAAAGNDALTAFAYALSQCTADMALRRGVPEHALRKAAVTLVGFRRQQIEAIIAYDRDLANRLVREHLEIMARLVGAAPRGTANPLLLDMTRSILYGGDGQRPPRRLKRGEEITLTLQAELVGNNWPEDHTIGSETGLMTRFGVSRSVLREAIRPLERLGVVEMRRGKNSGLKVTRPDPQSIIRSVVLYLNYARVPQQSVQDILRVLELSAVSAAAELAAPERSARVAALSSLVGALKPATAPLGPLMRQFYAALAQLTPNLVIELLLRILGGSLVTAWPEDLGEATLARTWQALRERFGALLDALEAGDANLARRRMMELRKLDPAFGTAIKSPEELVALEP